MDWIETPACDADVARAMENALAAGTIAGAVALHYPFPLGVTTIGKVLTPARGKPCFIASSTGTSSPMRVEAMLRNAIYGIAVAKADGISDPTVGIINLDGAQTVLRALQKLSSGGYKINFAASIRKDGGPILRGNDILAGSADVCVTDTLTGNVLMKLFAAWNTGGDYEALGWGYGPSAGDGWDKVVSIISGGNIDISTISALIDKALIARGRVFCFAVQLPDKPGQLLNVSRILAEENANVIKLDHDQTKVTDSFKKVVLTVTVETHNEQHIQKIIKALNANGYEIQKIY